MQAVAMNCTDHLCLAALYAAWYEHSNLYLQEILVGGVTEVLATAKAAYDADTVTLLAQLLEAHRCKQAAQEHAKNVYEQRRRSCMQSHTARLLTADNEQADKLKTAQAVYDGVVLAITIECEKARVAWEAAQSVVGERKTEQQQVPSRQDELVRHLTRLLNAAEVGQRVCTCQDSSCILLDISKLAELQSVNFPEPGCNFSAVYVTSGMRIWAQ